MKPSAACINMIKQQLRTNNVLNEDILSMLIRPLREKFVTPDYKKFVYADMQIPLNHGQIMFTPLEEALILQTAAFTKTDTVLEIGSGTGFLSHLLAQQCQQLISIDYYTDFIEQATSLNAELHTHNVEFIHQDATHLQEFPYQFDAIVCTAGLEYIPKNWFNLLKPQAKIFAPIGPIIQNAQWIHLHQGHVVSHEMVFQTKVPMLIHHQAKKFIF